MEPTYSDDGTLTVPNGPDDYDVIEPDYIPTSYVEDAVRHIIVRDGDVDIRYEYDPKTKRMRFARVF